MQDGVYDTAGTRRTTCIAPLGINTTLYSTLGVVQQVLNSACTQLTPTRFEYHILNKPVLLGFAGIISSLIRKHQTMINQCNSFILMQRTHPYGYYTTQRVIHF